MIRPLSKDLGLGGGTARHAETIELPDKVAARLLPVAARVARALQVALDPHGYNLVQNNGEAAGQEVFHAHIHVIPRYWGDAVRIRRSMNPAALDERERLAEQVRAALVRV